MKKILLMVSVVVCATLLTACAGSSGATGTTSGATGSDAGNTAASSTADGNGVADDAAPQNTSTPENAAQAKNADGFVFEYNSIPLYMDEGMTDVLQKLGEPRKTFEAPSCAFDGMDKIFSYAGIEIRTYAEEDVDYVFMIDLKDDSVVTSEGIGLGNSLDEVLSVYGDTYEQELGLYTYAKGNTYLSFLIEEDEVKAISYGLTL